MYFLGVVLHAEEGVGTADLVRWSRLGRARSEDRGGEGRNRATGGAVGGDGDDGGGDGAVGRDVRGGHDLSGGAGRRGVPPESGDTDGEGVLGL